MSAWWAWRACTPWRDDCDDCASARGRSGVWRGDRGGGSPARLDGCPAGDGARGAAFSRQGNQTAGVVCARDGRAALCHKPSLGACARDEIVCGLPAGARKVDAPQGGGGRSPEGRWHALRRAARRFRTGHASRAPPAAARVPARSTRAVCPAGARRAPAGYVGLVTGLCDGGSIRLLAPRLE